MLTALGGTGDGRALLVLGLSGENMTRLMAQEPICLDVDTMFVQLVGGRDEAAITAALRAAGLLQPGPGAAPSSDDDVRSEGVAAVIATGRAGDGRPILQLGLSGDNMRWLMGGEVISLDVGTMGLPPMLVLLLGAQDEASARAALRKRGLL